MKDTKKLTIAFIVTVMSVVLVMLALSTLPGLAQEGYPAPIDYGYPVGYPVDEGYPIIDPYPMEYPIDEGYPVDVGYPMLEPIFDEYGCPIDTGCNDYGYPVEIVSEPTFADEWQAEMAEIQEVIDNVPPVEQSRIYQTWQQLKVIVRHYLGKMIVRMR